MPCSLFTILAANMDFQTIQNLALGYLRRPSAEILDEVKGAINDAMSYAVASHQFLVLEQIVEGIYPLNEVTETLATIFSDATVKTVRSVQTIAISGDTCGEPLKIVTYDEIQNWKQRLRDSGSNAVDLVHSDHVAFLMGNATETVSLGLFPVPTENKILLAQCSHWLPTLSANADTNFILDKFYDYVLYFVCAQLFFYLRSDDRATFTMEAVQQRLAKLTAWDTNLRATTGTQL